MRWFKHDCLTRNDPRLQTLGMRHKSVGLSVYWILLEETGQLSNTLHLKISGLSQEADMNFKKLRNGAEPRRDVQVSLENPEEIPIYPAEILANNAYTTAKALRVVIATCVEVGLFDEGKWVEYNVLYNPGFAAMADEYTRKFRRSTSAARNSAVHEQGTARSKSGESREVLETPPEDVRSSPDTVDTTLDNVRTSPDFIPPRTEADTEAEEERDENSRTEQKQNGDAEAEAGPELQASGKFSTPYPHSSRLESNLSLGIEPERIGEYGENCRVIVDEWNRTHSNNFKWEITGSELKTLILGGERHLKVWVCTEGMNLTGGERSYPSLLYRAVRLMLRASEKSRIMNQSRWLWACLNGSEGSPPWVHQQTVEEESSNPRRNGGSVKVLREILAGADN
ncbi:MAG: DUF4373 domain-containing protein [Bacteroidetes bacterium]|nr:DUF4373 domain-containing protein [Bacteroidota bacterium]